MPFRRVAFFIKCRARGFGICSCSGGRPQLFREKCLNFVYRCFQKGPCATIEVDKNREKCLIFVYRILQNRADSSAVILGSAAKISLHAAHLHSALSKCSIASPLHPKELDFTKKEPPKIGRFLRCAAFIFFSVIRS